MIELAFTGRLNGFLRTGRETAERKRSSSSVRTGCVPILVVRWLFAAQFLAAR